MADEINQPTHGQSSGMMPEDVVNQVTSVVAAMEVRLFQALDKRDKTIEALFSHASTISERRQDYLLQQVSDRIKQTDTRFDVFGGLIDRITGLEEVNQSLIKKALGAITDLLEWRDQFSADVNIRLGRAEKMIALFERSRDESIAERKALRGDLEESKHDRADLRVAIDEGIAAIRGLQALLGPYLHLLTEEQRRKQEQDLLLFERMKKVFIETYGE